MYIVSTKGDTNTKAGVVIQGGTVWANKKLKRTEKNF